MTLVVPGPQSGNFIPRRRATDGGTFFTEQCFVGHWGIVHHPSGKAAMVETRRFGLNGTGNPLPNNRCNLRRDQRANPVWPMTEKIDIYDGEPWTDMDVDDLIAALRHGDTIEDAARFLCRSGTIDQVRRKAEELGLKYRASSI